MKSGLLNIVTAVTPITNIITTAQLQFRIGCSFYYNVLQVPNFGSDFTNVVELKSTWIVAPASVGPGSDEQAPVHTELVVWLMVTPACAANGLTSVIPMPRFEFVQRNSSDPVLVKICSYKIIN